MNEETTQAIQLPQAYIWEKQPGERPRSYQAFRYFRELGPVRTQAAVAQKFGVTHQAVQRMAKAHGWNARVEAWERWLDEQRREAIKTEVQELVRVHMTILDALGDKLLARIQTMKPEEISTGLIPQFLDAWLRHRRIELGVPAPGTDRNAVATSININTAPAIVALIPDNGRGDSNLPRMAIDALPDGATSYRVVEPTTNGYHGVAYDEVDEDDEEV